MQRRVSTLSIERQGPWLRPCANPVEFSSRDRAAKTDNLKALQVCVIKLRVSKTYKY